LLKGSPTSPSQRDIINDLLKQHSPI